MADFKGTNQQMRKVLVVCGPTAVGKTKLGIHLAKKFNGEIVSVDSRQVYKGMDIGTGKDLPINSKLKNQNSKLQIKNKNFHVGYHIFEGIPVWLLDIVKPNYRFSVSDYLECVGPVVNDIWQRGKLPILVGGTGFYIKAILEGIETVGIGPNWKLRKELSNYQIIELSNYLKKLDYKRWRKMNKSDKNNPRRLIRAIEIIKSQKSKVKSQKYNLKIKIGETLIIGLKATNKILYQRIDQRVDERIKKGMIEEVEALVKQGVSHQRMQEIGLEYRYIDDYLQGKLNREEMIQKLKYAIHAYARRQLTWFKKQKKIHWFDIRKKVFLTEM